MLKIKSYDFQLLRRQIKDWPQVRPGWKRYACGGLRGEHFQSSVHRAKSKEVHTTTTPSIPEHVFERCVELSILEAIRRPHMVFVEAGAGWGAQTLNIVAPVRYKVVDTVVESVCAYAVEAEPGHYGFLCETFLENRIEGVPIFGALADTVGWVRFWAPVPPADTYGQSIHPKKGNIEVPCYTLQYLVETFKIDHIDLLHMDIQGSEPEAVQGALGIIDRIDYLIVCPHFRAGHPADRLAEMLSPTHNLVLSYAPRSGYHDLEGFALPIYQAQDGLMVWERLGLEK